MKKALSLFCAAALLLAGCGKSPSAPATEPPAETKSSSAVSSAPENAEVIQAPETTAAVIPEATEASVPLSPDAYQVVYSYMITDDNEEFYSFQGLDPDGSLLWTRETAHTQGAQICPSCPVGTMDGRFYYCDSGALVALDVITGEVLWENPDFGGSIGSPNAALLDPNGFICLCGYFGPELFIADTQGNTVKKIDSLREDAYWPASISLQGDRLIIHLEGGSDAGTDAEIPMDWLPQAVG